jgi:prepilin-type N-terminal cleavage/methylation domain-containing protein
MNRRHRSCDSRHRPPVRGAFTLVEVLIALALTALVAAVTGQIAVSTLQNRQVVEKRLRLIRRDAYVFDRLAEDVDRLIRIQGEPAVTVFGSPHPVLQFTARADDTASSADLHTARLPQTVRYRLVRERIGETYTLIREAIDRTDIGAGPLHETLGVDLLDFGVELFVDDSWTRIPPTGGNRLAGGDPAATVTAVRVSCRWAGEDKPVVRTLVVPDVR